MPKKNYEDYQLPDVEPTQEAEPAPVKQAEEVNQYFTSVMWKDTLEVFKCLQCDTDRNYIDEMIEHVLTHYPPEAQENLLAELLTLKEKH
jgi:hypothetical protein